MKPQIYRLTALITVAALLSIFLLLVEGGYNVFEYAPSGWEEDLIGVEEGVGQGVSQMLWTSRPMDLVALAILLFTAGVCSASVLRRKGGT